MVQARGSTQHGRNLDDKDRIIVIGASAGGVQALLRMAARLSPDFPAPIVIVLHIGTHRSHLPELLTAKGPNPAVAARSGMIPRAGTIYVAPPDRHLLLEDGVFRLVRGPKEHHARPAIDPLFRSSAIDRGSRVVGVVLTGMLDDGAAGMRAIQACGGVAVVQDPDEAAEPSMPRSVLAGMSVDYVMRLDPMTDLLNELGKPLEQAPAATVPEWLRIEHAISLGKASLEDLDRIGFPSHFTCPDCGGTLFELKERSPLRFLCHTGHAFSLRSLATAQEQVADEALWTGLRALQEKQAILSRLATLQAADAPGSDEATLQEANAVAEFTSRMRALVSRAPTSSDVNDPEGTPEATAIDS
jgi:two-component system, chemotaxis family, protein-glutamate methylesterase/glutaminase